MGKKALMGIFAAFFVLLLAGSVSAVFDSYDPPSYYELKERVENTAISKTDVVDGLNTTQNAVNIKNSDNKSSKEAEASANEKNLDIVTVEKGIFDVLTFEQLNKFENNINEHFLEYDADDEAKNYLNIFYLNTVFNLKIERAKSGSSKREIKFTGTFAADPENKSSLKNKVCSGTVNLGGLSNLGGLLNETIDFSDSKRFGGEKCGDGIPIKIKANYETAIAGETLSWEGDDIQVENIVYDPAFIEEIKKDYLKLNSQGMLPPKKTILTAGKKELLEKIRSTFGERLIFIPEDTIYNNGNYIYLETGTWCDKCINFDKGLEKRVILMLSEEQLEYIIVGHRGKNNFSFYVPKEKIGLEKLAEMDFGDISQLIESDDKTTNIEPEEATESWYRQYGIPLVRGFLILPPAIVWEALFIFPTQYYTTEKLEVYEDKLILNWDREWILAGRTDAKINFIMFRTGAGGNFSTNKEDDGGLGGGIKYSDEECSKSLISSLACAMEDLKNDSFGDNYVAVAGTKAKEGEGLQFPVKNSTVITSCASPRYGKNHYGIDIRTAENAEVYASASGIVSKIIDTCTSGNEACGGGFGNYVYLKHKVEDKATNDELYTLYAHLNKVNVKAGEKVETDSIIGLSGNTGHSDGPHVHYEVHNAESIKGETSVDPLCFLKDSYKIIIEDNDSENCKNAGLICGIA